MKDAIGEAMLAYAQNGEALRPEQGYPVRLLLPGWEGNASVKWLRRIELGDQPFMTREETSKYTDPLADGTAREFSLVMDARSVITSPSYPQTIEKGFVELARYRLERPRRDPPRRGEHRTAAAPGRRPRCSSRCCRRPTRGSVTPGSGTDVRRRS